MTRYLYTAIISLLIFSCGNKTEVFETESVADYMPLKIGKYITYRLDSTVFPQSGSVIATHKYQVKHTVVGITNDNAGKETFVVQKQLNNETATGSWVSNGTYLITPYDQKIEVIENNMRVIVLQQPMKNGFSWKGNSYLPNGPYNSLYDFELIGYDMNTWEFSYINHGDITYQGQTYQNVWNIEQHNATLNIPVTIPTAIGTSEVSTEKYAKGIGLVYKNFQLYQYQPANNENPSPHYTGFAVTMWMVDHN